MLALANASSPMLPTCVVACLAFGSARSLAINTFLLGGVKVSATTGEYE